MLHLNEKFWDHYSKYRGEYMETPALDTRFNPHEVVSVATPRCREAGASPAEIDTLRTAMAAAGVSARQLAEACGVTYWSLRDRMSGAMKFPRGLYVRALRVVQP